MRVHDKEGDSAMLRTTGLMTIAFAVLAGTTARSQELAPTPSPATGPSYAATNPHAAYEGSCFPGPPACACFEDHNGSLLYGDPLLDWPGSAPPGWFGAVEAAFVGTHVNNHMSATVGADTVQLPTADLPWTVSPEFQLGYRFGQGAGELLASYRFLMTSGAATLPSFDAAGNPAALHSRVNLNSVDLDYASREFSLGPLCDMKWFAGIRFATVYLESVAQSPLLNQNEFDNYWGIGPHFGLNLARTIKGGWDVFCRTDISMLYGPVAQSYGETVTAGGGGVSGGVFSFRHNYLVPVFDLEVGAGWTPPSTERLHFAVGYIFQRWFAVETISNPPAVDSRGDLTFQGVFLRAEWSY
jgi:hypothetical protein